MTMTALIAAARLRPGLPVTHAPTGRGGVVVVDARLGSHVAVSPAGGVAVCVRWDLDAVTCWAVSADLVVSPAHITTAVAAMETVYAAALTAPPAVRGRLLVRRCSACGLALHVWSGLYQAYQRAHLVVCPGARFVPLVDDTPVVEGEVAR